MKMSTLLILLIPPVIDIANKDHHTPMTVSSKSIAAKEHLLGAIPAELVGVYSERLSNCNNHARY